MKKKRKTTRCRQQMGNLENIEKTKKERVRLYEKYSWVLRNEKKYWSR